MSSQYEQNDIKKSNGKTEFTPYVGEKNNDLIYFSVNTYVKCEQELQRWNIASMFQTPSLFLFRCEATSSTTIKYDRCRSKDIPTQEVKFVNSENNVSDIMTKNCAEKVLSTDPERA